MPGVKGSTPACPQKHRNELGGSTPTAVELDVAAEMLKHGFVEAMCRFFLEGKCSRGSKCSFAHTKQQLREKPDFRCDSAAKDAPNR